MKAAFRNFLLIFVALSLFAASVPFADAAVKVKGYYRKDGTYVQPHYRSNPDSNPYNNWSYPGNTNPYTGVTATGDPATYLKNYYNGSSPSSSYTPATLPVSPSIAPPPPPAVTLEQDPQKAALIQSLLALIAQLQAQLAALQSAAPTPTFLSCSQNATANYSAKYKAECKAQGLAEDCSLPHTLVKQLEDEMTKQGAICFSRYYSTN